MPIGRPNPGRKTAVPAYIVGLSSPAGGSITGDVTGRRMAGACDRPVAELVAAPVPNIGGALATHASREHPQPVPTAIQAYIR
jgi:hypothetical protein